MKQYYTNEIDKIKQLNELSKQKDIDKIELLEKNIKSLEDEFRSALIIESNRYNQLFVKYESNNQEYNDLKNNINSYHQKDERNKVIDIK